MNALYRFVDARCEGSDRARTFTLHSGETRLLQLDSRDEKNAMVDCAIGKVLCVEGVIEIMQGERRHKETDVPPDSERRHSNSPVPLIWQSLGKSRSGRIGWVAENGGLISNLRIWENVTLPLWYHNGYEAVETEHRVVRWLGMLGLERDSFEKFMAAQPYSVEIWQRKMAGLLRALLQNPPVLVVDAALFRNVRGSLIRSWIEALETYASEGGAVLAIADGEMQLHWERIA